MNTIKNIFKESLLVNFVSNIINKDYSDNFIIKFLDLIFNKSAQGLNKLLNKSEKIKKMINESVILNLFKKLTDNTWLINGFILALCLNIPHEMWNNLYIVVLMFLVTFIYYLRQIIWNENKFEFKRIQLGIVLFMIATVLSLMISFSLDYGSTIRYMLFYMTAFLGYMNIVCAIKTKDDLIHFCYFLFIMTILMGAYGIYQKAMGIEVNEAYIDTKLNEGMSGRAFGSVENPNNFAEVLLMMIPLCAAIFLGEKSWKRKIIVLGLSCMPILSMILTGTRSGWGALGIAAFLFCLFWDKRLVPAFIVAVCLAFVALPYISLPTYNRVKTIFVSNNDHSMKYRDIIMNATKPVLRNNWVSGIGVGSANFSRYIANNYEFDSVPPHSHNVYVQTWVEFGLIGIISLIMIILSIWIYGLKAIYKVKKMKKENKEKYDKYNYLKYITIAVVTGLVGYCVMGFLDYVLFYPRIMILFFTYIAIGRCSTKLILEEGEKNE